MKRNNIFLMLIVCGLLVVIGCPMIIDGNDGLNDFNVGSNNSNGNDSLPGVIVTVPEPIPNYTVLEFNLSYAPVFSEIENLTFHEINRIRNEHNLSTLVWAEDVAIVARYHSADMANNNYFEHVSLDGLHPSERVDDANIHVCYTAENLFKVNNVPDEDMDELAGKSWMDSPAHRANILDARAVETGMGVVQADDGTYYFTQLFIDRVDCGFVNGTCCQKSEEVFYCYEPAECNLDTIVCEVNQ